MALPHNATLSAAFRANVATPTARRSGFGRSCPRPPCGASGLVPSNEYDPNCARADAVVGDLERRLATVASKASELTPRVTTFGGFTRQHVPRHGQAMVPAVEHDVAIVFIGGERTDRIAAASRRSSGCCATWCLRTFRIALIVVEPLAGTDEARRAQTERTAPVSTSSWKRKCRRGAIRLRPGGGIRRRAAARERVTADIRLEEAEAQCAMAAEATSPVTSVMNAGLSNARSTRTSPPPMRVIGAA